MNFDEIKVNLSRKYEILDNDETSFVVKTKYMFDDENGFVIIINETENGIFISDDRTTRNFVEFEDEEKIENISRRNKIDYIDGELICKFNDVADLDRFIDNIFMLVS